MSRLLQWLVLAVFLAATASAGAKDPPAKPTDPAEKVVATEIANRFLDLIDGGQYGSTWEMTGAHMRRLTSRPIWAATLSGIRAGTGAIQSRRVVEAIFTRTLRESPPGHYYVIGFDSRFESRTMREKVLLNLERGQWRVEGYTVTPTGKKRR